MDGVGRGDPCAFARPSDRAGRARSRARARAPLPPVLGRRGFGPNRHDLPGPRSLRPDRVHVRRMAGRESGRRFHRPPPGRPVRVRQPGPRADRSDHPRRGERLGVLSGGRRSIPPGAVRQTRKGRRDRHDDRIGLSEREPARRIPPGGLPGILDQPQLQDLDRARGGQSRMAMARRDARRSGEARGGSGPGSRDAGRGLAGDLRGRGERLVLVVRRRPFLGERQRFRRAVPVPPEARLRPSRSAGARRSLGARSSGRADRRPDDPVHGVHPAEDRRAGHALLRVDVGRALRRQAGRRDDAPRRRARVGPDVRLQRDPLVHPPRFHRSPVRDVPGPGIRRPHPASPRGALLHQHRRRSRRGRPGEAGADPDRDRRRGRYPERRGRGRAGRGPGGGHSFRGAWLRARGRGGFLDRRDGPGNGGGTMAVTRGGLVRRPFG